MTLIQTLNAIDKMTFDDIDLKISVLDFLSDLKRCQSDNTRFVTTQCGKLHITPTPYAENYLDRGTNVKPSKDVTYYPGVSIGIENDAGEIIDLCIIEGPSDEENINMYVYGDAHSDEYTEKVVITKKDIQDP